jgi:hypothetical protein
MFEFYSMHLKETWLPLVHRQAWHIKIPLLITKRISAGNIQDNASRTFSSKSSAVRGLSLYPLPFNVLHRQKQHGLRYDKQGGHNLLLIILSSEALLNKVQNLIRNKFDVFHSVA